MTNKTFGILTGFFLMSMVVAVELPLGEMKPGGKMDRPDLLEHLSLNPEQMKGLEKIRLKQERERIRLEADVKLKMLDLREELFKENFDESRVKKVAKEMGELKGKSEELRIGKMIELRKMLTPEQVRKAAVMPGFFHFGRGPGREQGGDPHRSEGGHAGPGPEN